VAQQFINILLAESSLSFAQQNLDSFQQTLKVSEERLNKGAISEGDLLKIKLQMLEFQRMWPQHNWPDSRPSIRCVT